MNRPGKLLTTLIITILAAALVLPVQAQTTRIVAPDGDYATIQEALDAAEAGDVIEVRGGVHPAPLSVDKSVSLIGVGRPVIDGQGEGSLVFLNAPDIVLSGFELRGTGASLPHEDTAIIVQAPRVAIRDNILEDVMFGIYFADAQGGLAENNVIHGKPLEPSVRGDGIRVWYSNDVSLIGNEVTHGRDILIWYSDNIIIRDNHIHENRYGLHFMYNENATVQDNVIENNSVGAYMMYSIGLNMTGNQYINNRGASGYAVALKDMDHATVTDNAFVGNVAALYLDNSPSLVDEHNTIARNFIAHNDVGLIGLPSLRNNIFQDNVFLENHQQIRVQGRGNLLRNAWSQDGSGNYWSDYAGYDRDEDGVGDMPFRAEELFESLADQEPALRLFDFSPASQAIDFAASAFPSLRPDPKVIDDAPLMHYTVPAAMTSAPTGASLPLLAAAGLLLLAGLGVTALALGVRRIRSPQAAAPKAAHADRGC